MSSYVMSVRMSSYISEHRQVCASSCTGWLLEFSFPTVYVYHIVCIIFTFVMITKCVPLFVLSYPTYHRVTPTEAHFNSPRRASMLRDSRCSDQSLDFDGFDWSLGPPTPESSPRRKRESQPNIQPVPRRGSLSLEDKTHSHDRKSLSLDLKTRSLDRRTLRKEKNMDEEGKGILRTYSPRLGAVARMGLAPTRYILIHLCMWCEC